MTENIFAPTIEYNSADRSLEMLKNKKQTLLSYKDQILSETDTRCKIIDILFKEVLFWDESNIRREQRIEDNNSNNQYIDYVFESGFNKFLVEAKRSDVYFDVSLTARKCKRTGALSKNSSTKKALDQAYNYCVQNNINVGCISNGYTLVIFMVSNTDNKFDTYIFKDVDSMIENITVLYNVLSPYTNSFDTLNAMFDKTNNIIRDIPQFRKSVNDIVYDANEKISRNPIDFYIKPVLEKFFSDLVAEDKVKYLEECYCSDARTIQYEKQLTVLLSDDMPKRGAPFQDSYHFDDDFLRKEKEFLKTELGKSSDVMILVGGVGAGKTTFIHKYFSVDLPEYIRKNVIWIYVDFTKVSKENIDIKDYILSECLRQIREKYEFLKVDEWETLLEIYKPFITRMKSGPLKPVYEKNQDDFYVKISETLLEKTNNEIQFAEDVLKYLSQKMDLRKLICLTIDNADQKTEEFQKSCLKAAYEFSKTIKSLVVLSMREESYWKLRNSNPFDAYCSYAYHIAAPAISKIIAKRIQVAKKHLKKQEILIQEENGTKYKINFNQFLDILESSFEKKNNTLNISLFEALSVSNLRFATEMLSKFLISGHTNTTEYIKTYLNSGDYSIPFHAFVRSIALGDYKYYHSNESLIANLLAIEDDGFYSHFTKIRILRYLNERSSLDSIAGRGFISIKDMYCNFKEICNHESNFRKTLSFLLNDRLIQTDTGSHILTNDIEYVKITSAGYYYIEILIKKFAYLERLCEDTPILSQKYFKKIEEITNGIVTTDPKKKIDLIHLRLKRIEIFLSYLKNQELLESDYINDDAIKHLISVDNIISGYEEDAKEVKKSAYQNRENFA